MKDKYTGWSESFHDDLPDRPTIVKDGDDKIVAMFHDIENRDRVLACVDALKDFSDEALSSGVVGEMVGIIKNIGKVGGTPLPEIESILAKLEGK